MSPGSARASVSFLDSPKPLNSSPMAPTVELAQTSPLSRRSRLRFSVTASSISSGSESPALPLARVVLFRRVPGPRGPPCPANLEMINHANPGISIGTERSRRRRRTFSLKDSYAGLACETPQCESRSEPLSSF